MYAWTFCPITYFNDVVTYSTGNLISHIIFSISDVFWQFNIMIEIF